MELPPQVGHEGPGDESPEVEDDRVDLRPASGVDWRVEISDADVRAARELWLAADDGDASDARVDALYEDYLHVVAAQAQQLVEELRRQRPAT